MALDPTQFLLIVMIGIEVGILFGIRRVYVIENRIEKIEEHIDKLLHKKR